MSDILVIASSVDPNSKSQRLARLALQSGQEKGYAMDLLDLRDYTLPLAGAEGSFDDATVLKLKKTMQSYRKFIVCVPIYVYDVSASTKNFFELLGGDWLENCTLGFICAAAGQSSYMSVMNFASALMLDFRVWIVPRFVYTVGDDWLDDVLVNKDIEERITALLESLTLGPG